MATLVDPIAEQPQRNHRLGRHVEHDERSRRYRFDASAAKLTSVSHLRQVPIFDQGDLGSCTGNAGAGALGTEPFFETVPGLAIDESLAVTLYRQATMLDSVPGAWPPDDTGSTGLAVAKAMQAAGYIAGYQHTFSLKAALAALQVCPVLVGINWYDSFDYPDAGGMVRIRNASQVVGGHEIVAIGLAMQGSSLAGSDLVTMANSWGTRWGRNGYFSMTVTTFDRLLSEAGDVTVPVPRTKPAPTPEPAPTPSPEDVDRQMWSAMKAWAQAKGLS